MKPTIGILGSFLLGAGAFFIFQDPLSDVVPDPGTSTVIEAPLTELPSRLLIPSIGVDAAVQMIGLATGSSAEMGVPTNFTDVGWYRYGPRPGMPGSAVITGHLNGKHVPQAVFYDLSSVKIDDEVFIVDATGTILTFRVVDVRTYTHDAPTQGIFMSKDGHARLNLITCAGNWLKGQHVYDQRTVVFSELVSEEDPLSRR